MKIKIRNRSYDLGEPKAVDSLNLAEWAEDQKENGTKEVTFAIAQFILASLKATYKDFMWFEWIEKLKYLKFIDVDTRLYYKLLKCIGLGGKIDTNKPIKYIYNYTSEKELSRILLENGKKKSSSKGKKIGREVAKYLISETWKMPPEEVEQLSIKDYNMRLFTIFNKAGLQFGKFEFMTPEEQRKDSLKFIEESKRMGYTV